MNKMDFLDSYQRSLRNERRIEERIIELRARKMSAGAIQYTGMPHGSGTSDLSDYMVQIEEKLGTLADAMKASDKVCDCICECMEMCLDDDEYDVLYGIYIKNLTERKVAQRYHFAPGSVHAIKLRAIDNLEISKFHATVIENLVYKTPA